ncbi:phage tail protein, partial [Streptococcus equi]|nr:phage tail protein [Streptococcus equi]
MILHDVEIYKDKQHYYISDNPFTKQMLRVVSYDVKGAGYDRSFSNIDRVNGRFHN